MFLCGGGVEGAKEEEGEEAEEEEGEEAEEEEGEEAEDEEGGEDKEEERKAPVDIEPELSIPVDVDPPPQPPAPRPKSSPKGAGAVPPPKPAPKHGRALPPGALLDAPPQPPAMAAPPQTSRHGCRTPEASAGVQVWVEEGVAGECEPWHAPGGPGFVYIPGRWVDRRHPLTLRRLGAPRSARGVGHLYALFFEAHPDGTMRTRVCETGGAGYAEVEYICTHLGTLFEGVPGCTKMLPVHFWVSPPKRETKFSVRRNGNRGVARCALLLARNMAHWIKEGHYVPLEDLPGVGAGVGFTTVAEMWEDVAMLAALGGGHGT